MNQPLADIVNELYAIDPSLRAHADKLEPLVAQLLAAKPKTKLDTKFVKTLRAQLLTDAAASTTPYSLSSFMQSILNSRWAYAASGALLALLIVLPTVYYGNFANTRGVNQAFRNAGQANIARVDRDAFGSLSSLAQQQNPRTQSGGGGGSPAIDSKMIWPGFQSYRYVYQGDALVLSAEQVEVYKRLKGLGDGSSLAQTLSGVGGNLIDLSAFANASVRNVEFFQDIAEGYSFGINLTEGTVYVNANYERWFTDSYNCGRADCPQPQPMTIGEMPSDEQLLAIASAFVGQYRLNTASYGQPFVDNAWRAAYDNSTDKSTAYIPEVIDVVYPLAIQGEDVRDSGGNRYGMHIQVHARANKVYGVWGLHTQQYQSASYAAETDADRVIKMAQSGGLYGFIGEPAADAVEVTLGTPTQVLMQFTRYANNTTEDLFVPALMFPVLNAPKDMYVPSQVMVPLAKDILDGHQPPMLLKEGVVDAPKG